MGGGFLGSLRSLSESVLEILLFMEEELPSSNEDDARQKIVDEDLDLGRCKTDSGSGDEDGIE